MKNPEIEQNQSTSITADPHQKGTAIVLALFVLALMSVFVALAVSRTTSETVAVSNEASEARTLYAAQGSLETMTRNFNKVFETRLNPLQTDIDKVEDGTIIPGLSQAQGGQYTFDNKAIKATDARPTVLNGGDYSGLVSIQDNWRLRTVATNQQDGTQIQLTRNILNNRIPIFQFGVFYNDDLELFNGPTFAFGGRVHSNRHFFLHPSANGAFFDSRVTAAGHIVTQIKRNGDTVNITSALTRIKNASGTYIQLDPDKGSVLNGAPNVFGAGRWVDASLPTSRINGSWTAQSAAFDGNLKAEVDPLRLPLNVGANTDLIEMIKRGNEAAIPAAIPPVPGDLFGDNTGNAAPVTTSDNPILKSERFANKTGIRVSLADSQAKLPGCATGVGTAAVALPARCGVRLDGNSAGLGANPVAADPVLAERARGYRPKAMTDGYQATRLNGQRMFTGGGRQVWIKIESVQTDPGTSAIVTEDITEDILSLGVTEQGTRIMNGGNTQFRIISAGYNDNGPNNTPASLNATGPQPASPGTDSRSIIKLQRFFMVGPNPGTQYLTSFTTPVTVNNPLGTVNVVERYGAVATQAMVDAGCVGAAGPPIVPVCSTAGPEDLDPSIEPNLENRAHLKWATINNSTVPTSKAIVPFPIEMFDAREGFYYDSRPSAYYATPTQVPRNGVMSMIDIDVANLRRFLRGDFNGLFPANTPAAIKFARAMLSSDIPQNAGWVLYVSDRRGDGNFDGEYDMEDVYSIAPGNSGTGILHPGEDLDGPVTGPPGFVPRFGAGVLDARYFNPGMNACVNAAGAVLPNCDAPKYADSWPPDQAAVIDHPYYRRGVRLINGTVLPGIYNSVTAANTRGFTVATENGIYVQGNYNATGVSNVPAAGTGNTLYSEYLPFDTPTHIPASVVADAVTILSNAWNDGASFRSATVAPYNQSGRLAADTTMRFAMISGDTITSATAAPNQGGGDPRLNGGLHNFKRFLEDWGGRRLDYTGSIINLYNSRNNNGTFKCCTLVYSPPRRNWVFDSTFLDPGRIPPGTPFFQYVQTTGFERSTE
jgi:hypothetical protein